MSRRNNSGVVGVNRFGNISRMSDGESAAPRYATNIGKLRGRLDDRKYYRGINLAEANKYDVMRSLDSDYFVDLLKEYNPLALYAADRGLYTGRSTQLTATSTQYWSVASNSTLQAGNVDLWFALWFYIDSNGNYRSFVQKANSGSAGDWQCINHGGVIYFDMLTPAGNLYGRVSTAAPSSGEWHFGLFWQDVANNTVNLKIDNGSTVTAARTGTPLVSSEAFTIGSFSNGTYFWDGRIDSVFFGKPATPIASIIADINTYLYNSGSGRAYADLSTTQKTAWGLISAYDFDGDGLDSHGSNHLTAVNSPTYVAGKPNKAATTTGDPIVIWEDQSGNNRHLSQDTLSKRPTLVLNYQYGEPALLFDGTDDFLSTALSFTTFPNKRGTLIAVIKNTASSTFGTIAATYVATSPDWQALSTISGTTYGFYDSTATRTTINFDVQNLPTLKTFWRDSDTTMKHRRNADESDSLTHANVQMASNPLYCGAILNGVSTQDFFAGYIMSLALFGDLSLDNVRELEFILNNHYRIYS